MNKITIIIRILFAVTLFQQDTKLKYSTAFHPHTDVKTEVINNMLVQLLRGYSNRYMNTWDEQIVYISTFL
jgi:hypothetical protein